MSTDGPVESYLDAMFDRLAGTGPAGRRLLADAEAHLLDSAASGRDRGLSTLDAEREAVARFGPVDAIARGLPAPTGRIDGPRVLVGAWVVASAGLLWYGSVGALTWLLAWPWAKLVIGVGRFGPWPPCDNGGASAECLRYQHDLIAMVPAGGVRFPYALVGLIGAAGLTLLVVLRRSTRLGTPAWTPTRASMRFALAVPFAVAGTLLTVYGTGQLADGDIRRISAVVAGLVALAIALVTRRRRARFAAPDVGRAGGSTAGSH